MEEPKSNNAFQEHFRILSELVGRFNWNTEDLSFPVIVDLSARRAGKAYNGEPVCSTYSVVQMPTGELNLVMYYGDSFSRLSLRIISKSCQSYFHPILRNLGKHL